ncbi:MAG: 30S ribosomal protein S12 methylthiotransferase RimO [Cytophagales bacterium]|nr:30S ribosomal protein S12 methylthiotransferase RimO [Cytophagales bacterium]
MKTKALKKDKVNVVTLGCSKNIVDSENLITQLKSNEIDVDHESEVDDSNIVIVNTCGFIENAKQESIDTILQYAEAKDNGEIEKLYVTGCLSQRYKDSLEEEIPQVDAYFGTLELPLLLKKFDIDYKHELVGERITTTAQHFSYLKIAEGCDRPCSFCAIPLMRGKHVSRPIEELVKETESLVKRGTKEIILIAQELTYYGIDLYKERALAKLLRELSDIKGLEWIRLHYAYPSGFPMDVLEVMAERDNICNYLDIPLQHGANKILKLMRRGITREKTEQLVHDIREKVPNIAIRTTLIVGHPGETEEDFEELCQFVRDMRFDRLGVFTYSHEENTHSYTMEDDVPEDVKEERVNIIMGIQQEIAFENNLKYIGNTYRVLIDRKEGGYFIGRTEFDSPEVDNEVLIDAKKTYLSVGDFCNIKIVDATDFDLYGEVAQ